MLVTRERLRGKDVDEEKEMQASELGMMMGVDGRQITFG